MTGKKKKKRRQIILSKKILGTTEWSNATKEIHEGKQGDL